VIVVSGVRPLGSPRRGSAFLLPSFGRVAKIDGCVLSAYDKFVSHNVSSVYVKRAVTSGLYSIFCARKLTIKSDGIVLLKKQNFIE
jgi:hypothetical protein